jgi:hypothetical protein
MNPSKTNRKTTTALTDLPNVGPSIANDLRMIGLHCPTDLKGKDPLLLYNQLNLATGQRHDLCVLDVFMSVVDFMNGNKAKPWWEYTAKRKKILKQHIGN